MNKIKTKLGIALICLIAMLIFTACSESKAVNANVDKDNSISGNVFGKSALVEIGDNLWYDTTTLIVYWWNGQINQPFFARPYDTTPTPYYAPNGLPYRYNPETCTFEEIQFKEPQNDKY